MPAAIRIPAAATRESDVLKAVLALDPLNLMLWRNNRGALKDRFGRWVSFGVGPNGASDIIGLKVIRVTQEMVGKRIAQFCAIETKRPKGSVTDDQQTAFIDNITAAGGCAGLAYSVEDAIKLLGIGL